MSLNVWLLSMSRVETQILSSSPQFLENKKWMESLLEQRKQRLAVSGSDEAIQKHKARGKMTAWERVEGLIDPGSFFLELAPFCAWGVYDNQCPKGGLVTGVGIVQGREVIIVANDACVKGGTYFPLTVKKHLRAQEIAIENALPCIYLVDSGGAFLPQQAEVFPDKEHFGRIFFNQAQMSALGITQISVVMGSCTAGGAYVPAMSDETVIVQDTGTIFLGGPPLVKAATGEIVDAQELGGALVHSELSGVVDHVAANDEHALFIVKDIVKHLSGQRQNFLQQQNPVNPFYSSEELLGLVPKDDRIPFDIKEIIARIVDESEMHEFKPDYGSTLVTGFSHIEGYPVGILANNGILFSESALKGAHFIQLCEKRRVPILFLQNIAGFMVGKKYENEGIVKHGAKMVMAVSNATVPKFTVVIGGSYGAGNYGMCGRAYSPRQLWMWPNARISVMGGAQAANVLWQVKNKNDSREEKDFKDKILAKYNEESESYYSSARVWDDGIIDPRDTRKYLALGISLSLNKELKPPCQGVFRM